MVKKSLAQQADDTMDGVLRASGFSRNPNVKLENFKGYWKSVNRRMKSDVNADGIPDY